MFWLTLLVIGVALTFSTMGAMSVWLSLFALGAKGLAIVIFGITLWSLWKHFFKKDSQ